MTENAHWKLKAPNKDALDEVVRFLQGRVAIYITSEKRLFLTTGKLTLKDLAFVEALGFKVGPETQYTPD